MRWMRPFRVSAGSITSKKWHAADGAHQKLDPNPFQDEAREQVLQCQFLSSVFAPKLLPAYPAIKRVGFQEHASPSCRGPKLIAAYIPTFSVHPINRKKWALFPLTENDVRNARRLRTKYRQPHQSGIARQKAFANINTKVRISH